MTYDVNVNKDTVSRLEHEDNEYITDEPAITAHSQAFARLSMSIQQVEAQMDCDPVSIQLLNRLQQNVASNKTMQ